VRSLLIVTSLQKRADLKCVRRIKAFKKKLSWEPLEHLLIDRGVWEYVISRKRYDPKLVFCHPGILEQEPTASLYYRGVCGLSLKAAKDYFGSVEGLEAGRSSARLSSEKALAMARTYNAFICSIINNSTAWTLENGCRTVIATLGITLDGVMRNRIGAIAEDRIRTMVLEWLIDHELLVSPRLTKEQAHEEIPSLCTLQHGVVMRFSSDPDIAFLRDGVLQAIVEIKGGIDPAGALERYGAATKTFQHAISASPRCRNFYLTAAVTHELRKRIDDDRLVERTFDIVEVLDKPDVRRQFFQELFHHALRLV
jgi:hypothetical protein